MGIPYLNSLGVINTIRNISTMQRSLYKTGRKLPSGLRTNSAADDPAGLVISERMRAQIGTIAQELANLDNNINKSGLADQAMTSLEDKLVELRELAIGAADSASNDRNTLRAYQDAANDVVLSYNRVIESASFGSQKLLDGSEGSMADLRALDEIDLSSPDKAAEAVEKIDQALSKLSEKHVELGANTQRDLVSFRNSLEITQNNMISSESAIRDTDYAKEQTMYINLLIRQKAGMAVLAQGNLRSQGVFGLLCI